ncbi:MAG TPA: glutamate--tRNA ligase [Patescibacteria group bacterium]
MSKPIRVRIAPSPTGDWHLGNARTALFTYLFARHHGGEFFLRVEDTDQGRLVEGAVDRLLVLMEWLGLTPDLYDGLPYVRQSDRLDLYKEAAEKLIAEGKAYYCFATGEELAHMRSEQEAAKLPPRYDNRWGYRDLPLEQAQARIAAGDSYVIRFKMPQEGETVVVDLIRGEVRFANNLTDDFVMIKADGFPTYHLAHVVDDHLMEISHVTRGDEWLSSVPKHVQLHEALGWDLPEYIHFPVILGPDKGKLSKRHGAKPVFEYEIDGYLPEALINFLALIGWSSGTDEELFSLDELIKKFDVKGLQKSPAVFDATRLDWFNGQYIRRLSSRELSSRLYEYYDVRKDPVILERFDEYSEKMPAIIASVHERLVTLKDFAEHTYFYFVAPEAYDPNLLPAKKQTLEDVSRVLEISVSALSSLEDWSHDSLEQYLRQVGVEHDLKVGDLLWPLRVALTGLPASPSTFDVLAILGKDESLKRIAYAQALLAS